MNKQTEFGAFLESTMLKLAKLHPNLSDGQRRAMLARARREMLAQSKARKP